MTLLGWRVCLPLTMYSGVPLTLVSNEVFSLIVRAKPKSAICEQSQQKRGGAVSTRAPHPLVSRRRAISRRTLSTPPFPMRIFCGFMSLHARNGSDGGQKRSLAQAQSHARCGVSVFSPMNDSMRVQIPQPGDQLNRDLSDSTLWQAGVVFEDFKQLALSEFRHDAHLRRRLEPVQHANDVCAVGQRAENQHLLAKSVELLLTFALLSTSHTTAQQGVRGERCGVSPSVVVVLSPPDLSDELERHHLTAEFATTLVHLWEQTGQPTAARFERTVSDCRCAGPSLLVHAGCYACPLSFPNWPSPISSRT